MKKQRILVIARKFRILRGRDKEKRNELFVILKHVPDVDVFCVTFIRAPTLQTNLLVPVPILRMISSSCPDVRFCFTSCYQRLTGFPTMSLGKTYKYFACIKREMRSCRTSTWIFGSPVSIKSFAVAYTDTSLPDFSSENSPARPFRKVFQSFEPRKKLVEKIEQPNKKAWPTGTRCSKQLSYELICNDLSFRKSLLPELQEHF